MNGQKRGPAGPPLQAYSHVTNPERFRPLHKLTVDLLDRLELAFDVERTEGYGLDPELEARCQAARPSVSLAPRDVRAAPVTLIFTAFPGVYVRFGRWCIMAFPACGCDACDETFESEAERLTSMIESLIRGHFREAIVMPTVGAAWIEWEFWKSATVRSAQRFQLDQAHAQKPWTARGQTSYQWKPWTRRK
jgi:hypothetical protein